jgi:hypothetical protein
LCTIGQFITNLPFLRLRRTLDRPTHLVPATFRYQTASSLRDVKGRIRPLSRQERIATSAGLFLDALLGPERRKTGWMRAEAAGDPGPWRQTLPPWLSEPSPQGSGKQRAAGLAGQSLLEAEPDTAESA